MAEERDLGAEIREHLDRWNKPSEDYTLERVVGVPVPEGDTRATNHVSQAERNRHITSGQSEDDDLSGDDLGDEFDDASKDELQDEAEARGLSKSGSKAELRQRIREYDRDNEE